MISCPSAATLARLGIDSLDGADFASIEQHIEVCADCRDMLDRLHRNDAGSGSFAPERLPRPDEPPKIPGFVIERELGRGSMSVVYLARQPSLGRLVALKVVRSGPSAGSHEYARWLREGRSFSLLKHENVVRLHDLGEANGWLYLVLEYVPGGTLNDALDAPYAPRDAARLLATIAGAVAAIHREGLLHLDLKPSNILIEEMPATPRELATPRVGDFGLAYRWDDPDATANAVGLTGPLGTPRYMAPEQVDAGREKLGPPADIYGLGALLYHVLTGRPPFVAPSVAETLDQVRNQEPVPPRRLNPAIPRDLETICLKCLRKPPGQRYQSADAVADDLHRFLDGVAISARPVSPLERTWRWGRRRPAVAALASMLMLSLVGGFLGMFLLWRRAESQRGRAERARGQAQIQQVRAEEAQARAEADFQLAGKVLDELVELNVGGMGGLPKSASPEYTISVLRSIRRRLFDLAPRLPDRARTFHQLNAVDARMSDILGDQGRWDELRILLEESLRASEVAVREYPGIRSAWRWRAHHLAILASISEREGKMDRCKSCLRQSIVCDEMCFRVDPKSDSFAHLIWDRRALARVLAIEDRRAEAGALLLANHRSLRERPPELVDELVVAERVINRIDFLRLGVGAPPPPRVDETGPPDAAAALGSPEADHLPAEAWAKLAAKALRLDHETPDATIRVSRVASYLTAWFHEMAAAERRASHLDRARQVADRFVCFARLAVNRNPGDPTAHLLLADAFDQLYKNAWRPTEDRPAIERNLRQAIAANQRALELAPYHDVARRDMERRQRKLADFLHPEPSRDTAGAIKHPL